MNSGVIDITRTIGRDTLTYPGDTLASLTSSITGSGRLRWEVTTLNASCHIGTHIDAPAHYIEGGRRLSDFAIDELIMDALVIDTGDARRVEPHHLAGADIGPGMAVLFRTANGGLPRDRFSEDYVHIAGETARLLAAAGVRLVGIDYLSVDPPGSGDFPAHEALLGAGVLIMEDADLRNAAAGSYTLFAFPLRLHDTEAAPCRAVLRPS